ncbi:MAG: methyltransferase domain-containing protein [Ignavibacteria bacterium]|nr:methyltransferase domain-containing protein [Ignavibacteria bacterium]MBI3766420.1 methyltransferase domain-containing protein [Ignavibacteriales bacterium]
MKAFCCTLTSATQGADKFFSRNSRKYLKRFLNRGLAKEQRYLVEGILSSPIEGQTILEIGCGVGGLHMTLLKRGAISAIGIDIAEGMLNSARQLSRELGLEKNTTYIRGDFTQTREEIPVVDIVILDKVICCYEDVNQLLVTSLEKTRRIYALSFPKPTRLVKLSFLTLITLGKLLRWSFSPYWHDWNAVLQFIHGKHFKEIYSKDTFAWSVHVFAKESDS